MAEGRGSVSDADLEALESVAEPWQAHDGTVAATSLPVMARRLPSVLGHVLRTCWAVSRADTAVLIGCTVIAQVFTAVGLLATTGALDQLLTAGPTPARVKAAAPALILVVISLALRAALNQAASWTTQRLSPQVRRMVETELYGLTTGVELTDGTVVADRFRVVDQAGSRVLVELTLHEGRKHVVRRMLAKVGHPVSRLVRTQVGPVSLGSLRPGATRRLTTAEVGDLYAAVGM